MNRQFVRRSDVILIILTSALAVAGWLIYRGYAGEKPAQAEIYFDGQLVEVVDLTDSGASVVSITDAPLVVIRSMGGGIRFESSDCPDQVCVHTGSITLPGAFAACLPNKVLIQIVAAEGAASGDAPDIVIR